MTDNDIINISKKVGAFNSRQYNLLKLKEECLELALIITQLETKPKKVEETKPNELYAEIADVTLRLFILMSSFNSEEQEKVTDFMQNKARKYKEYLDQNKYSQI